MNLKIALFLVDAEELSHYLATEEIETIFAETLGPTSRIAAIFAYTPERIRNDKVSLKLERASEVIELQPLLSEDWFRYFSRGFKKVGCEIEWEARYEFESLAYAGPYFLLTVASRLWDKMAAGWIPAKPVTKVLIHETVDEIADSLEPHFAAQWRGLTLAQRRVVSAVIKEDDSTLLSPDVLSMYRLSGATMERELLRCESLGIFDRDELGESDSWIVPDVFFRSWVEKNQTCAGSNLGSGVVSIF